MLNKIYFYSTVYSYIQHFIFMLNNTHSLFIFNQLIFIQQRKKKKDDKKTKAFYDWATTGIPVIMQSYSTFVTQH